MRFRFRGIEFGNHPDGKPGPINVRSFDPAGAAIRSQDHDRLGRDGVVPGREFLGAATWAIELSTNARFAREAREIYSKLQELWHDPAQRWAAGELYGLDYEARGTGEWRRVYGRPRMFDPANGDVLMLQGAARFGVEFEVLDPRYFSGGDPERHTLTHASELQGGWEFPVEFPLVSEEVVGARQGALTNKGTTDTPVFIEFNGPIQNPRLRGSNGWSVGWNGTLLHDERLTLDPVRHAVTKYDGDGRGVPGFSGLTRSSQLSRISIPPGLTNVFFSGVDETHSSTAVVEWRHANQSF